MKMKNYKALFALLIIGLLVITGCSDFLNPPKPSANGTLLVTVNGADGRTILPAARLDKYVLTLSTSEGPYGQPRELKGSTAIELPAGTYTVTVDGYVGDAVVASGSQDDVVIATGATQVSITLTAAADGEGTFSWDFAGIPEEVGVTGVEIEIYDIEDDTAAVEESADITGELTLDAGVYNVKFTVKGAADAVIASWWEILYIYKGLTSAYDHTAVGAQEVLPTIPYEVPASGYGYFYLDLNDWKTKSVADGTNISGVPVTGATAADGLTANFSIQNQRVIIGLTAAQIATLKISPKVSVTVVGSATPATQPFRYHLGNGSSGSGWDATTGSGDVAFSELASEEGITKELTVNNPERIFHFILQQRSNAGPSTITINSIKITYDPTAIYDGGFDLDLSEAKNATSGVTAWNILDSAVNPTFADEVLTATFTAQYQRVNFPLSVEQQKLLFGDDTADPPVSGAETIYVTIWGSADPDTQARYHIGDPDTASNWNSTGGAGNTEFSKLASDTGITSTLGVSNPERGFAALMLNYYDEIVPSTFTISKIRIDYKLKPVVIPCGCTSEQCATDPFRLNCTLPAGATCSCPRAGTALANLDSINGLMQAGSPKFSKLDDGGLFVYDRPNDYSAVDLQIVDTSVKSPAAYEIGIDADIDYSIKVTGRAVVATGVEAQIVRPNRPYNNNVYAKADITGTAGEAGTFEVEVESIKGSDIFYREDADGTDVTDTTNNNLFNSIRIRVQASSNPSFIIDTVEIYALDAQGDPDGEAIFTYPPSVAPPTTCECTGCPVNGKTLAEAKDAFVFCTCTACTDPICKDIPAPSFTMPTGGLALSVGGNDASIGVLSDSNTLVTVTAIKANSSFIVQFSFPQELLDGIDDDEDGEYDSPGDVAPFDPSTDTLLVKYAAIVWPGDVAPVTFKKGSTWTTINNGGAPNYNAYKQFATSVSGTFTLPAGSFDAGDGGMGFQLNDNDLPATGTSKFQFKILSVEIAE